MKIRFRFLGIALTLALALGASAAYAQGTAVFETSFAFHFGKTVYQPGKYEVRLSDDQMDVTVTPTRGAASVLPAMTRLAEPEVPMSEGKIVFDRVGEIYYLSEIWLPGYDGILLHSTKEKHSHVKVKLDKKG